MSSISEGELWLSFAHGRVRKKERLTRVAWINEASLVLSLLAGPGYRTVTESNLYLYFGIKPANLILPTRVNLSFFNKHVCS